MEQQLFTWREWDIIDTATFMFYNVTLVDDELIAKAAGFAVQDASVDYENGTLCLYDPAGSELKLDIGLRLL